MKSEVMKKVFEVVKGYLIYNYNINELNIIYDEIQQIMEMQLSQDSDQIERYSYEQVQNVLSSINEKERTRKKNGVYYTSLDVVKFILMNSIKFNCGKLKSNNINNLDITNISYKKICYDPTCGAGAFLLEALKIKLNLLDLHCKCITQKQIAMILNTIHGNDINIESVIITKIRLFMVVLNRYGINKVQGISKNINSCFTNVDFITNTGIIKTRFDIIVGNPPYVEDSKSESKPTNKYGNIYANVLENAALLLKPDGVLGFIIPLSYISTIRMRKIRKKLDEYIPEQYIMNYADRPDCLFTSVHQKLSIFLGRKNNGPRQVYTRNYQYWYKEERYKLFNEIQVIKNNFIEDEYIPKLGTKLDSNIYKKIISKSTSFIELIQDNGVSVYLNMRATFWIKAFLNEHKGSDYKELKFANDSDANFSMCILNSSLFWWYWICISDCWHITRKELIGFKIPKNYDCNMLNKLAIALEQRLEETKVFVGTKQTEYEYKHKNCIEEIHKIDDYINKIYGLNEEESIYVKNIAIKYRTGGGVKDERN